MKVRPDAILRPEQAAYLERMLPPRDPLLAEMEAYAREHDIPISDPEVGRLLEILARGRGARRILEVGAAIGYGTLCLTRGAPAATVVAVERDPERAAEARGYLTRGGVMDRVEILEEDAIAALDRVPPPFDLVYLDCDKADYRRALDRFLPKMTVGGLVVVDNLLWMGEVADPPADPDDEDPDTEHILAFNGYFLMHPQLHALLLPLGDGVGLGVKTQPLVTEVGGPF